MKKVAIVLSVFSILMISCKETKKEIPNESESITETVDHENRSSPTHKPDDAWLDEIILNNGVRWQANKETTNGVTEMMTLINATDVTNVGDYKELGVALNEIKNTVVRECTMKGASHDNLHVWLHPLIEKIEMLQNVKSTEEGAQLTSNIKAHLEGYFEYFI